MQECSYELYVAAFRATRAALSAQDAQALSAIRSSIMRRHGVAHLASVLAVIEAERGAAERTKADVCGGMLCANRCPDAAVETPRAVRSRS